MDLAKADQSVREIPRSQLSDSGVPVFCDGITAMQYAIFFVCVRAPRWEATSLQKLLVPSRGFHAHEYQRKELPAQAGDTYRAHRGGPWHDALCTPQRCPPRPEMCLHPQGPPGALQHASPKSTG